ncbi:MAG: MFS transporter [Pseudomonadota bacterium]
MQAIFSAGSVMLVSVGGIVGSQFAPSGFATLPVSLMVLGTALATVPASLLMSRVGRRWGTVGASTLAIASALLAANAVEHQHFAFFCLAAVGIGATMTFGQQLRFAAAECVSPARAGQAVSFILMGSIGGAFLGAELVTRGAGADGSVPFRSAFLGLAAAHVVAVVLVGMMRPLAPPAAHASSPPGSADGVRPLLEMVRSKGFALAVIAAVVGQGVMTFLMTATPIAMHVVDGHAVADTAAVVRAHVIAMYAPSLLSALLIAKLGVRGLMWGGTLLLLACVLAGFAGHEVMHYFATLVLLGVGWNFLFVGGTTALVAAYRPAERFRAQAVNEFCVFGTAAVASLLAGSTVLAVGWERLLLSVVPVLLFMLSLLSVVLLQGRRHPA